MNVDNVKSQMRKGMLEYCILLLLHKEPLYASDIILKLKEARLIVVEGTLYPLCCISIFYHTSLPSGLSHSYSPSRFNLPPNFSALSSNF